VKRPPFTCEKIGDKMLQRKIEEALGSAAPRVQQVFARCIEKISAVSKHQHDASALDCRTVVYTFLNGPLTRTEITLIHVLLQELGWDVRLATPLTQKREPKPIELIYYHDHRSRDS
jgi:hypothetical protein